MTIRPVDMQTIIPKIPEVQKARSVENEIEKNNLNINIHKEQQHQEKSTKQVIAAKKSQGLRIDREGQQKGRQDKQKRKNKDGLDENKNGQSKETKGEILTKIDIRI